MTDLQELLRRATEIEAAAAATLEPEVKSAEDPLVPQVVEALLDRIEGLESSIKALSGEVVPAAEVKAALVCPKCGSSNVTEYENGTAECDDCGAYVEVPGGMAMKADDPFMGAGVVSPAEEFEEKGFDFDALADDFDDLDEKAWLDLDEVEEVAAEVKALPDGRVVLSELELLRARRAALQD